MYKPILPYDPPTLPPPPPPPNRPRISEDGAGPDAELVIKRDVRDDQLCLVENKVSDVIVAEGSDVIVEGVVT